MKIRSVGKPYVTQNQRVRDILRARQYRRDEQVFRRQYYDNQIAWLMRDGCTLTEARHELKKRGVARGRL